MQDFSQQLTVFLLVTEHKKNFEKCIEALQNQTVKFTLDIISDVSPMSEAFNQMLVRCKTPYFVQCDEDMVLYPNAIETMMKDCYLMTGKTAQIYYKLHDFHLNKTIGAVKLYDTKINQQFPFSNVFCCELQQKNLLQDKGGYNIIEKEEILGLHSPCWEKDKIFAHYKNMGDRQRIHKCHDDILPRLYDLVRTDPSELNIYALLGMCYGLAETYNPAKERSFKSIDTTFATLAKQLAYNYLTPNYIQTDKQEDSSTVEFITFKQSNHPYIQAISAITSVEEATTFENLAQSQKPVLIWNGYHCLLSKSYDWQIKIKDLAKKQHRPVYIVERGALPDTIYIDKYGFLNESSSYNVEKWDISLTGEQLQIIDKYIEDFKNDSCSLEPQQSNRIDKKEFYNHLNLSNYKTIVFVPLQVKTDTTILKWADWVKSVDNFVKVIESIARNNSEYVFLIKNHPCEEEQYVPKLPNIKLVDSFHYKDCLAYSDIVVTINSGLGVQALFYDKPVILVGDAWYQSNFLNYKVLDKEELIYRLQNFKYPNKEKAKRFLYYLKFKFYSECIMEKLRINASKPTKLSSITFEHPNSTKRLTITKKKIAILLTTFLRDNLLYEACDSIKQYAHDDYMLLIADQGRASTVKTAYYEQLKKDISCEVYALPFDCGLSYARNFLVEKAKEYNLSYCLLFADSLRFIQNYDFESIIEFLNSNTNYGIVGFPAHQSPDNWRGSINLIPEQHFLIDIPKEPLINYKNITFLPVEQVSNLFLAKTNVLLENKWDNELKLMEFEDFFWRLKTNTSYKVFYTDYFYGLYTPQQHGLPEYNEYRRRANGIYMQLLEKKYNIARWMYKTPAYERYIKTNCLIPSMPVNFESILTKLTNSAIDFVLLKDSCLDGVYFHQPKVNTETLYLGVSKPETLNTVLLQLTEEEKKLIKITLEYSRKTKITEFCNVSCKVAFPVVSYLEATYHKSITELEKDIKKYE
jgi:hypothetical protein